MAPTWLPLVTRWARDGGGGGSGGGADDGDGGGWLTIRSFFFAFFLLLELLDFFGCRIHRNNKVFFVCFLAARKYVERGCFFTG